MKFIFPIKIFSESDERIQSPLNQHLSLLIPVIYGAVFSYTMYVFSKIGVDLFESLADRKKTANGDEIKSAQICFRVLIAYSIMTVYMISDVGAVIKINGKYLYKRTSRYTQEFFIALGYIFTFSLLYVGRIWAIVPFCLVVVLGGLWFNNLKEEYSNPRTSLTKYAKSQRGWHYIGAIIIIFELALRYFLPRIQQLEHSLITKAFTGYFIILFGATMTILSIVSKRALVIKHGRVVLELSVDALMPDYISGKFLKKNKFINK